jgi:hypothetical protein
VAPVEGCRYQSKDLKKKKKNMTSALEYSMIEHYSIENIVLSDSEANNGFTYNASDFSTSSFREKLL